MVMTSYDSPAAARRRLRLAVRKAREASGLTQGQVAEQLSWSISKVNRMENGEVTISPTDLSALLNLFGVNDREVVNEMSRDAKAAKQRGWWHEARYREHVTPAALQLFQFESEATTVCSFQPTFFPGLLQTAAYATAVMEVWSDEVPPEARAARLEVRAHRRARFFEQARLPAYRFLLDESVIHRILGNPTATAEQTVSILETLVRHPGFELRIVPFDRDLKITQLGPFTICDLDDEPNAILYRENTMDDSILLGGDEILWFRRVFDQTWDAALNAEQSRQFMLHHVATVSTRTSRAS